MLNSRPNGHRRLGRPLKRQFDGDEKTFIEALLVTEDRADSRVFRLKVPDAQLHINTCIRGMKIALFNEVWTYPQCNIYDGY